MIQTAIQTFRPLDPPSADELRQAASLCGAPTAWTTVGGSRQRKPVNPASRSSPRMQAAPPIVRRTIIRILAGGKPKEGSGFFYEATLISNVHCPRHERVRYLSAYHGH